MTISKKDRRSCICEGDSAAQEADAVGPVPRAGLPCQRGEGADQSPDVGRGDGLVVDEDDAGVGTALFGPGFEQRWDGAAVVGDEGEALRCGGAQAGCVVLAEESAVVPVGDAVDEEVAVTATEAAGHRGRDVLVEEKLEHANASRAVLRIL